MLADSPLDNGEERALLCACLNEFPLVVFFFFHAAPLRSPLDVIVVVCLQTTKTTTAVHYRQVTAYAHTNTSTGSAMVETEIEANSATLFFQHSPA